MRHNGRRSGLRGRVQRRLAAVVGIALTAAALALAVGASRGASNGSPCATRVTPGTGALAIAGAIVAARDGSTVCFASGRYPFIRIVGATHRAYVTIRPLAGARVSVAGIEAQDSSFLRFRRLRMTEGFNMRDTTTYPGSHDYQFIDNAFAQPLYGIVLDGGAGPIRRVLIEGNRMHRVHLAQPEVQGRCSAGYAQGQDVTIVFADGVTIAHNVFNEAAWHYIQGGGAGPQGVDVEHNLFEGHVTLACSHLNLWQIWNGGVNDTFKDNIAIGEGSGERHGLSEEAATDGLIFENGPGSAQCATTMRNTVIENNLFVDAASSYAIQIYSTQGVRITGNTVVKSQYGSGLLVAGCPASTDATMTHNINVQNTARSAAFSFDCAADCLFDENVSDDETARGFGAGRYKVAWRPKWFSTRWKPSTEPTPPRGFYIARRLPFATGYRGGGGP